MSPRLKDNCRFLTWLILTAWVVCPPAAFGKCKVNTLAQLPVTMNGLAPTISAKVNGSDAVFIVDSGAFFSAVSPAAAIQFNLKLRSALGTYVVGVGGAARIWVTTVKDFRLAGFFAENVDFIVGGSDPGAEAVGLLGQNVLAMNDVEYDLANGVIRLIRPVDALECSKTKMAYWANDTGLTYSLMEIDPPTRSSPHTIGTALLNGSKIRVEFDTGSPVSMLTLSAAERVGAKPDSSGVTPAGAVYGLGRNLVKSWIATFANFTIGQEEIRNAQLRIADTDLQKVDMLIGADFFLSHRLYVANRQAKVYFTYNGGPVFNLKQSDPVDGAASAGISDAKPDNDQPREAEGFSRRGTAFAARRDYKNAIVALTRACDLNPKEPKYFYQRAMAYLGDQQSLPAMADLDRAIELKADDLPTRLLRGELRLTDGSRSDGIADLEAAARAASQEADERLLLGQLYSRAGLSASAVAQFDLWIAHHGEDARLPDGLKGRCWARALLGSELEKALMDCNKALKLRPKAPDILDSRGLALLRLGEFDKAIADYTASLRVNPSNAWALYGRGLAELRKGMSDGQADLGSATSLAPSIAAEFSKLGLAAPTGQAEDQP